METLPKNLEDLYQADLAAFKTKAGVQGELSLTEDALFKAAWCSGYAAATRLRIQDMENKGFS